MLDAGQFLAEINGF